MIKIAICDDSEFIRNNNQELITKYSIQKDLDCKIEQFENGESLLQKIDTFDLIFLDYQFENKGADGMEIARDIRKKNSDVTIIFITSYTGVVYETFEVGTFRFLDKPIKEDKLFKAMDDFVDSIQNDNSICIKAYGETRYIKESQITYIEGAGKYCTIHLINSNDPVDCMETLSSVEEMVESDSFFRCHKSFVVNLKYIDSFTHSDIVMQDGEMIAISRNKYKPFSEAYANYMVSK